MCTELRRDPRDLRVAGRSGSSSPGRSASSGMPGAAAAIGSSTARSLAPSVIFSAFATAISFAVIGRTDDAEEPNDSR